MIAANSADQTTTPPQSAAPPDWRWRAAQVEAVRRAGCKKPTAGLDPLVNMAADFVRDLEAAQQSRVPEGAMEYLARKYPGLHAAWLLRSEGDATRRDWFEAFVLARIGLLDAARRCGLTESAGVWYEKLFFAVTSLLENENYILLHVLRPTGRASEDAGLLGKRMAYFCGEKVLAQHLRGGLDPAAADDMTASRAKRDLIWAAINDKLVEMANRSDSAVDPNVIVAIAKHLTAEDERVRGSTLSQETITAKNLVESLGMGTTYGGPATTPEGMKHAELRAGEELALELGMEPPPNLASMDIVYPEHEYK
jgi:hypothetical protein